MSTVKPPQPPPFFSYTPDAIIQAGDTLIATSAKVWDRVAAISPPDATFANSIQPIIDDENARSAQGRILYFLAGSSPNNDVRVAAKKADIALKQDVIERCTRTDVFAVVDAVSQRPDVGDLPAEAQVYLRKLKEEFVRNGLALEDQKDRTRLKEVNMRLADLQSQYVGNFNADVSGIWLTKEELDGLAPAVLERFKQDEEGRYFVNFKRPNLNAVLSDVHNANTRRKYYIAWDNRLKECNGPLLHEILRLRRESALLLGFRNFAESKDQERMLSARRVSEFLDSLKKPLMQVGQQELDSLAKLKKAHLETIPAEQKDESSIEAIFRWDSRYYQRLAKLNKVNVDTTKVAEYFSFLLILPKLLDVFSLVFGLRFETMPPKENDIDIWHEDVRVFAVWNSDDIGGEFAGYLYIDPYPRDGKYGHVGVFCAQLGYLKPDGTRQYPTAVLMANYPPPTQSRPSLLKYGDVVNLFHELGHAVHNLVGRCTYSRFHGSQVTRDFTEIPSRLLEHFFWDPNMIRAVSCHYEKPELQTQLPEDMIRNTIASRYDYAATTKLNDLTFAIFDQVIHTDWEATDDNELELSVLFNKTRHEYSLLKSVEDLGQSYDTLHGQTHFRAIQGAYAASYYTYTSADAFSTDIFNTKFKPLLTTKTHHKLEDIVNDELRSEGLRYRRAMLEPGSSTGSEAQLIRDYLGRDPDPSAFIEILAATTKS